MPLSIQQLPVIDLLALAWLLAGVLMGLLRGLSPLFGALLWVLVSLWLSATLAPVLLRWLPNTEGTDQPPAQLLAYASLAGLALGLPLLGRLLGGRRGQPRQAPPSRGELGLGVVAGLIVALLTLTLALPFLGRLRVLGRDYPRARICAVAIGVQELLPWLYPTSHRMALARLRHPGNGDGAGGPSLSR